MKTDMAITSWGVVWKSKNKLDGESRHLMYDGGNGVPAMFATRKRAQVWITTHYGYIRTRPDLKNEPHGWRLPKPTRVVITVLPKEAK